jgi:hypothetical protein
MKYFKATTLRSRFVAPDQPIKADEIFQETPETRQEVRAD